MDTENLPPIVQTALEYVQWAWDVSKQWLLSPEAWSQFGLLLVAYLLAYFITRKVQPVLTKALTPSEDNQSILAKGFRFIALFVPLILPLLAFAFTAAGEQIVRSIFDSGAVIAFGKRVFLFIAARILARDVIQEPFLKTLAKFFLVPVAALYALGLLPTVMEFLEDTKIPLGNLSFNLLWAVRFALLGGIIFWLGRWSNEQSTSYIEKQEMRPATKQLATKSAEIFIFGAAFLILMNIMGISLTSLAVLGGAVGVGLGFGLQKIASNFASGVILLLEGQATVGDYVELDGGEAGTIIKMTARATFLETFDGRWIVVPNEDFITTRVVNYSDSGSANRIEVEFSVHYDTDINQIPDLIVEAASKHPGVLQNPEPPDCELRGFGDSGIDFALEFWVEGIDDGKNRYSSEVLFIIWNTLKENGIKIPYPHRVVELKEH